MDYQFKSECASKRKQIEDLYEFRGCKIGRGTYGHVYKATPKDVNVSGAFALKQIDGCHGGISVSACREIATLRELNHPNVVSLRRVFLSAELKQVSLLFDYSEYDLWKMIHFNRYSIKSKMEIDVPKNMVKSIMAQLLTGLEYLHSNWIIHRDIKPANILVMGDGPERGRVKIGDLGFARLFTAPLRPMADVDPVVVTHWYRSPELLLGTRHYTKAIDIWAVGCLFIELITSEALFISRHEDISATRPYNAEQIRRIISVLGFPKDWDGLKDMPEYHTFLQDVPHDLYRSASLQSYLETKYKIQFKRNDISLISQMLAMDPLKRPTAIQALADPYFKMAPFPAADIFEGKNIPYPKREFIPEDSDKVSSEQSSSRTTAYESYPNCVKRSQVGEEGLYGQQSYRQ